LKRSLRLLVLVAAVSLLPVAARAEAPSGQMTLVYNISIVPRWFDPAESEGLVTPFIFYYALHDALVKPMPGNAAAPCLAESWSASADGLSYEFVLRKGAVPQRRGRHRRRRQVLVRALSRSSRRSSPASSWCQRLLCRGRDQLLRGRRDPGHDPADGAGGLLQGIRGQAAQADHPEHERGLRQRRHATRRVRRGGEPLHLRQATETDRGKRRCSCTGPNSSSTTR
jgi:hypothetical protein